MRSGLPIDSLIPAIRAALDSACILVVDAPPGAGKSTVLPLALLDEAWLRGQRILMLEPRRLATRAVARRMAATLGEPVGLQVGYRMRLESRVGRSTRIEVLTEGILTRMLQNDAALEGVGCVIFDEFHERSLQADLGLAFCLDAQATLRPDLRLLVMSATLDSGPLAAYLGGAPVLSVQGRVFPVATRHAARPLGVRMESEVAATVTRVLRETSGDLLVFLPGAREIERVRRLLEEGRPGPDIGVFALYGDLPQEAQDRALAPSAPGLRKVVLATSIAETSLTIEGVRVVIDSGLARRARFDPRTGLSRLETSRVSRAAADQRRGRAGRLGPGICYRLWTDEAERALVPFTPPEILDVDLAPLALELACWGVSDVGALHWLTPPPAPAIAQARDLLAALGALDGQGRITAHGRNMERLGLHPRLAHMILEAQALGLARTACELAALLSERDVMKNQAGARSADLRLRFEALHPGKSDPAQAIGVSRGARERLLRLAARWMELLPADHRKPQSDGPTRDTARADYVGLLLAYAYPDRVARARTGGDPGHYVLSSGCGAFLTGGDALAREEFLVIADLDAGDREAKVYLAAPVTRTLLERYFAHALRDADVIAWSDRAQAVLARRERRLYGLVVAEAALEAPDPELAVTAMLEGVRLMGIECLPWDRQTRSWQARVNLLRSIRLQETEDWPEVHDTALLASLPTWLAPWLRGITRREHLARLDLRAALGALLNFPQQRRLDELAPTHIEVPSGSRIALDYTNAEQPVLAVRLQEVFGLRDTPRVAGGRLPVTMHLLSPAGRPVQMTQDLASFWAKGYHEVRKELKGRYPKHYWPEDPHTAEPTRRAGRARPR